MKKPTTIGFFNNKGGVGKTSLAFHLGWMFCELGHKTLLVDLDPQSNLSAFALREERLEELWSAGKDISRAIAPVLDGDSVVSQPHVENLADKGPSPGLLVGNPELSTREDEISQSWTNCLAGRKKAFRDVLVFAHLIAKGAEIHGAEYALVDVGPNMGAINRSALIACDFVVIPLSMDLFSLWGVKNVANRLKQWRKEWEEDRLPRCPDDLKSEIPSGRMEAIGHVKSRFSTYLKEPAKAYERWGAKITQAYAQAFKTDDGELASLKDYRSTMQSAQEAHLPIFRLPPAFKSGHRSSDIESCRKDFEELANKILERIDQRKTDQVRIPNLMKD